MKPDPDDMNDDRAAWADEAIRTFQRASKCEDDEALPDLLADLMHWADRNPKAAPDGFDDALRRAQGNYEAETTE